MVSKMLLACAAAGIVTGCAAPAARPDVTVYTGPRDPASAIPAHLIEQRRLAELERQKDDMAAQLHFLGLRCFSVDGDEVNDRVTVRTDELDKVRAAIAEGRLRLPPKFAFLPGGCDTFL